MSTSGSQPPTRLGIPWVLRQAALGGVLFLTAVHLIGVVCLAVAERKLEQVAATAVVEASLPAASPQSVWVQAVHQLERAGLHTALASVNIHRESDPYGVEKTLRPGDEVLLTITSPSRSAIPSLLGRIAPWLTGEELTAVAKIVVP